MGIEVRHLAMIRAIHEEGTLTAAARRLFVSQPALGRRLASLERRLGARLFERHARGMTLTREGRRLLQAAERILEEVERAEHEVKLLARGYAGPLRITTECYMCYHWLPRVARAFAARFPRVEVQLVPEATRDPYAALERSAVDVALVYSAPPDAGAVVRTEIFEDELVAVVASGHALARAPYLAAERLESETLLCHYAEPGRGVLEREFLERSGVRPKRTAELLVTPAVLEMARAGYGVAVVPRWILDSQASLDGLAVLPLGERGLRRMWHAARRATRSNEPVLESMIEVLREELRRGAGGGGPPERRGGDGMTWTTTSSGSSRS